MTNTAATAQMIHKWELKGLGTAPFRCVGVFSLPPRSLAEANPSAYNAALKAMPKGFKTGTCSVCGMALLNNFLIRAACGQQFSVGCDCVAKTGDAGLVDAVKAADRAAKRLMRHEQREAERLARLAAQRERNGGLTDWEVSQEQLKAEAEQRIQFELAQGVLIRATVQPIINALSVGQTGFKMDMLHMLEHGRVPQYSARDLCAGIYAAWHAAANAPVSRGPRFKAFKQAAMEEARAMFKEADMLLTQAAN